MAADMGLVRGPQQECMSIMPQRVSVRDNLQNKKDALVSALADVQEAIDAMDANPEVSNVLELLTRAGARL